MRRADAAIQAGRVQEAVSALDEVLPALRAGSDAVLAARALTLRSLVSRFIGEDDLLVPFAEEAVARLEPSGPISATARRPDRARRRADGRASATRMRRSSRIGRSHSRTSSVSSARRACSASAACSASFSATAAGSTTWTRRTSASSRAAPRGSRRWCAPIACVRCGISRGRGRSTSSWQRANSL